MTALLVLALCIAVGSVVANCNKKKRPLCCREAAANGGALNLHYRWLVPKVGCASEVARKRQIKNYFVCRFLATSLGLHYLSIFDTFIYKSLVNSAIGSIFYFRNVRIFVL